MLACQFRRLRFWQRAKVTILRALGFRPTIVRGRFGRLSIRAW